MKHFIWSSDIDLDDYRDFLAEAYPEVTDENEKYQIAYDLNDLSLQDEKTNLDVACKIIGIADIGRWNGRKTGYRLYDNLNEIFNVDCDMATWYVENQTLKADMIHHDGSNYVKYYVFNEDLKGADDFLEDLYQGNKISKSRFYKYCKSAGKVVKNIYGF